MKYDQLLIALKMNLTENKIQTVPVTCYEASGGGVGFFVDNDASAKELADYINANFFSSKEIASIQMIPLSVKLDKKSTDDLLTFFKLESTKEANSVAASNNSLTNYDSSASSSSYVTSPTKTFINPQKNHVASPNSIILGDPVIGSKKQILLYENNPVGYLGYELRNNKCRCVAFVKVQKTHENKGFEHFFLRLFEMCV